MLLFLWLLTVDLSQDVDLFGWSLKCDFLILFILFKKFSFLSILSLFCFPLFFYSHYDYTNAVISSSFVPSFIHSFSTLLSSTHWIISVDLFANSSLFFCQFKAVHFLLYFFCFWYCTFTYFLKVYQCFSLTLCRYGYLYTRTVVMWAQGVRPHRAKATEGWELSDMSAENRIISHWAISLSPTFQQLLNFYYYISLIIFNIW